MGLKAASVVVVTFVIQLLQPSSFWPPTISIKSYSKMPPRSSQRQNAPNTSNQRPICVFYKQGAGCWKKDKCSFRHIERRNNQNGSTAGLASNSLANAIQLTSNSGQAEGVHVPNNPTPCKFFASGSVLLLAELYLSLLPTHDTHLLSFSSSDLLYRFCHRGASCWFTHIDPSNVASTSTAAATTNTDNANPAATTDSSGESSSKKECGICMEIPDNYGLLGENRNGNSCNFVIHPLGL